MAPSQSRRPTGRSAGGSLPSSSARNPTQRSVPANRRSGAFRPASPPAASSVRATPQESIVPGAEAGEARDQDDDVDDDLCQVVMAVDMREGGTVGCAYYVAEEERLYILEDVQLGGREVIETLKMDIEPTVVLLSTRADNVPPEYGDSGEQNQTDTDLQFQLPYHVDVRPSQEFSFDGARTKLSNLRLESEGLAGSRFLVPADSLSHTQGGGHDDLGYTEDQGRLLYLGSSIDLENLVSIGCAGALLTYLQRQRSTRYLQDDPAGSQVFVVRRVTMLTLRGTMFINKDTLSSLQVVQSESHPNAFNQGPGKTSPGSKESLSIYGLFQRFARTPQGKNRLRQHFIRPSSEVDVIRKRQDFISVFLRPENEEILGKLSKSFRGIKNLRPVMVHLRKGVSSGNARFKGVKSVVWATLLEFAFHCIDVHQSIRETSGAESLDLCKTALHKLDLVQLHQIGRAIHETVDLQSSIEEHRTVVNPYIDQELDKLKETHNGMDSLLNRVAMNIAATLPERLGCELNVIYFPQLGFNVAMPLDASGRAVYSGGEEAWDQVFTTENRAYFKDFRMREMDESIGDIYSLICEKEIEIVYGLAQRVLTYETMLVDASDICGEIDSLLALVHGASLYKLVRPQVIDENVIDVKDGRHLLHEATVASYVPNDTYIVGGRGTSESASAQGNSSSELPMAADMCASPSMLVLTGPNYSGKSVYLKQAGLIVYLAHVGSFVPAESARIGITDKILTRITTRETVSKIQSTFMTDLQQISFALNQVTNRSLLIVDEFGKGTNSTDGAGLACGLLDCLLSMGDERPKVLAATHFHEIFENGFLPPRPELAFGHMEVRVDAKAQQLEDQVTYLYNFRPGRSNESFGTNCAAMNGIDPAIIARANEIASLSRRGEDLIAVCAKMTPAEMDELEDAEMVARRFLETDLSEPARDGHENIVSILDSIICGSDGPSSSDVYGS